MLYLMHYVTGTRVFRIPDLENDLSGGVIDYMPIVDLGLQGQI